MLEDTEYNRVIEHAFVKARRMIDDIVPRDMNVNTWEQEEAINAPRRRTAVVVVDYINLIRRKAKGGDVMYCDDLIKRVENRYLNGVQWHELSYPAQSFHILRGIK